MSTGSTSNRPQHVTQRQNSTSLTHVSNNVHKSAHQEIDNTSHSIKTAHHSYTSQTTSTQAARQTDHNTSHSVRTAHHSHTSQTTSQGSTPGNGPQHITQHQNSTSFTHACLKQRPKAAHQEIDNTSHSIKTAHHSHTSQTTSTQAAPNAACNP